MAYVTSYMGLGYLVSADDGTGRDMLVQVDYDYPGLASDLGWTPAEVRGDGCPHDATDGTVDCPNCGTEASAFIESAVAWLDAHEGESFEDPGYFGEYAGSPCALSNVYRPLAAGSSPAGSTDGTARVCSRRRCT